jgi:hypothetical protein
MLPTWSPLRLSIAGLVLRGSMRAIPSGPEIPNDLIFKAGYMVATFCVVTLLSCNPGMGPYMGRGAHRHELLLKIAIRVSPRTVNKYMPRHFAPSPRRILCGPRRSNPRMTPSRIHTCGGVTPLPGLVSIFAQHRPRSAEKNAGLATTLRCMRGRASLDSRLAHPPTLA